MAPRSPKIGRWANSGLSNRRKVLAPTRRKRMACASLYLPPTAGPPTMPRDTSTPRSEEHTSELQSLMRISYAVFCLKKKKNQTTHNLHRPYQVYHTLSTTTDNYTRP